MRTFGSARGATAALPHARPDVSAPDAAAAWTEGPLAAVLLLLACVAGVGWLALTALAPHESAAQQFASVHWLRAIAGTGIVLPATILLISHTRRDARERGLWRPVSIASGVIAVGFIVQSVAVALDVHASKSATWQTLPFEVATLVAMPCLYWGVVQWNRIRMSLSNGSDWLNGLTAVFAIAAIGNLVIRSGTSSLSHWPWWQLQGWIIGLAAGMVLFGTAATIGMMGRSLRDARPWWVCAALALVMGTQLTSFGTHSLVTYGGWPQTGWLLAFVVFAWLSQWKSAPARVEVGMTMSTVIGMMVVLASTAITLATDCLLGHSRGSRLTALYAVIGFVGASTQAAKIIRDLSQLAQSRQEARTDALTGTANRRALVTHLNEVVASPSGVCLLVIDLDRFKDVNDQHGHSAGDQLLCEISERLEALLPPQALLARLGGDEFAMLLESGRLADGRQLAAEVLEVISSPIEVDGRQLRIGASVGIAAVNSDPDVPFDEIEGDELLRRADVAMYVAKQSGSGHSVYHAGADAAARERLQRLEELKTILADSASRELREQLVVHYQAQLNADTREIIGAEALVRWQHPRLGMLGPDAFLDLAEENGLMGRLTARVINEACGQAARWREAGRPIRIAVNLSTSSLTDLNLLPTIDGALADNDLDPGALTLEITETTIMADREWCLDTTREIAARGIAVSIDDYGTGYSSLAYLSDFPAAELKLDRTLTARITGDKRTAAVVAGTIELAHRLDLRLVAEGVEDEATLTALRALNCDEVQGYLFGKPGPAHLLDAQFARPTQQPSPVLVSTDRARQSGHVAR